MLSSKIIFINFNLFQGSYCFAVSIRSASLKLTEIYISNLIRSLLNFTQSVTLR